MQNSEYGRFKTNQMKEHLEIIERFEPLNRRQPPTGWAHEVVAWVIAVAAFVFIVYAVTAIYHHTIWGMK